MIVSNRSIGTWLPHSHVGLPHTAVGIPPGAVSVTFTLVFCSLFDASHRSNGTYDISPLHWFNRSHTATDRRHGKPGGGEERAAAGQQQGSSSGNRIQVGACLSLDQIKLYVVSKDGSKAEVGVRHKQQAVNPTFC